VFGSSPRYKILVWDRGACVSSLLSVGCLGFNIWGGEASGIGQCIYPFSHRAHRTEDTGRSTTGSTIRLLRFPPVMFGTSSSRLRSLTSESGTRTTTALMNWRRGGYDMTRGPRRGSHLVTSAVGHFTEAEALSEGLGKYSRLTSRKEKQ